MLDEFELSLGEVSERVGRSKPPVSNRLRLLELPEDVLAMLERGELTEGHARAVLAVPGHEDRRQLARKVVGAACRCARPSVRPAGPARGRSARAAVPASIPSSRERATEAVARVTGLQARVANGRMEIPFDGRAELAEIAETFERLNP